MKRSLFSKVVGGMVVLALVWSACDDNPTETKKNLTREESIPGDAVKVLPDSDVFPPVLHDTVNWSSPVPMVGPVNTAGAEDSPFITPDGERFFFFFTPDMSVPPQQQLLDGVTGIWWCRWQDSTWSEPVRIYLNNDVALDGSPFVMGDTLWFGSIRAGNYGEVDIYRAVYSGGGWGNWTNLGLQVNDVYNVGEFHISADGQTMYYDHDDVVNNDTIKNIWLLHRGLSGWEAPEKVPDVNSSSNEAQPFLTQDGMELWFTGPSRLGYPGPAIFRSLKTDSGWGEPVEIISNFSGEPSLDANGNIYFVHHFYTSDIKPIEADIYVAYRKVEVRR